MDSVTKFLQQYTFEPIKHSPKLDQHELTVEHDHREIPLGKFKIRLKNIDNQHDYPLKLKQQLRLTTKGHGLRLNQRLHGVHVHHASSAKHNGQFQLVASLKVQPTTKKQSKTTKAAWAVPVEHRVAESLPIQVPLYVFDDSQQLVINQTALAKLFLNSSVGKQFLQAS
ncbi:hypothetical protein RA086_05765 [Lactiplantibacillus sp. WILCCON 0030]|uniref:Uncharacterized protein n=1 Tax=Lactiplantibacillus brownii TaxID=3069269 RepID=A0ABU1A874_9LACO|nr:hypothetical protein [Lactiplantibacillus brownii]MDQ7937134.1 hypothetical protein [Lactiplantibacillus brownii]